MADEWWQNDVIPSDSDSEGNPIQWWDEDNGHWQENLDNNIDGEGDEDNQGEGDDDGHGSDSNPDSVNEDEEEEVNKP